MGTNTQRILAVLAAFVFLFAIAGSAFAQDQSNEPPAPAEGFPYELKLVDAAIEEGEDEARQQWAMSGFDPAEFGGNDTDCTNTELDAVRWIDEISSPDEDCLTIFEWSLKDGDETLASGMYALEPEEEDQGQEGEWIRFSYEQSSGKVRFVGTLWRLPKGWNAHQLAVDLAADWQVKNEAEWTVVGLSPTDDYITGLWQAAEAESDGGEPAPAAETECSAFSPETGQPLTSAPGASCAYDVPSTGNTGGTGDLAVPNFFQRIWNFIVGGGVFIMGLAILALIWWIVVLVLAFRRSWIVGIGLLALGFLLTPLVAAIIGQIVLWRAKPAFWAWRPSSSSATSTTTTTTTP